MIARQRREIGMENTENARPTGWRMAMILFVYFIRIGAFTFGSGWSILTQMEQEFVDERHWITKTDLLELIAVGKSLPGIMVVNITLLFGYQMAGPLGGVLAAIGLSLPAIVVLTIVTAIYDIIKDNHWVWAALKGVRCAVVPIIGSAAISLGKEALKSVPAVLFCAVAFAICYFTSVSNLLVVVCGALLGLVIMGVKEHGTH